SRSLHFSLNTPSTTKIYTLSLHDALPISGAAKQLNQGMSEVVTNMESIYQGQVALTNGLNETKSGITQIKNGKVEEAQAIESLKDRKSTRLNSSHVSISYAVFCLKKKKKK